MDVTSLYELRERLKAGAIAGTELISGDFRLKRALEGFAPLMQVSPVFEKIGKLSAKVLEADCPERTEALLDAVSLADAVLCTQAAVSVSGELEPVPVFNWGAAVCNAPYSVLAGLLDALENSGGGRYSLVMDTRREHPELFSDYRVKAALVRALSASYAELADQAAEWLKEDGPDIVPMLKKDFDNRGKKDMARRVKVIEALAGAKENDFYLSQLEGAQKEVKLALIYALRHSGGNAKKLLELARTEKGNARTMAYWALSFLEEKEVWDFWEAMEEKKPGEAMKYMAVTPVDAAGRLAAKALLQKLAPYAENGRKEPLTKETAEAISQLFTVLPGKSGPMVCECYRLAAGLGNALDRPAEGIDGEWVFISVPSIHLRNPDKFSQAVPAVLHHALLIRPTGDLKELAAELYESYGKDYFPAAFTAWLLTEDAPSCYERAESLLERKKLLGIGNTKELVENLVKGLSPLFWDEKQKTFVLRTSWYCPSDGQYVQYIQPLAEPLSDRFYDLLMRCRSFKMDQILCQWIQPDNRSLNQKLGEYFYNKALIKKDCMPYLTFMKACGWTDCSGLAAHYYKSNKDLYLSALYYFILEMPGDAKAKEEEALRVLEELEKGGGKRKIDPVQFKKMIDNL